MSEASDRNLLIGVLALQLDFVSRDEFVEAISLWSHSKGRPLEEILFELKLIDDQTRQLLGSIVDKRVAESQSDSKSSAARGILSSVGLSAGDLDALQTQLESLDDEEVRDSLQTLVPDNTRLSIVESPRNAASDQRTKRSSAARSLTRHSQLETLAPGGNEASSQASRFLILRPHAKGGLGEVAVALDTELNRQVALKQIQSEHADDEQARQRFLLEAEVTGGLEHPGVVPVYGLGRYQDGRPYYAMRFIRGESLHEAVDRYHSAADLKSSQPSALEFRKLLVRFVDVCQAIEYAHSRGVLHRDIKPENIMLGPYGETLIVDWGLAKAEGLETEESLALQTRDSSEEAKFRPNSGSGNSPTRMGSVIGTPAFMSPEQAEGRLDAIGPASDVYSLGATLYYLLTGKVAAIAGGSDATSDVGKILARVSKGIFPRPHEIRKATPKPLEAVCLKAMARRPEDRYATAQELAEEIERYLADEPVSAHRESLLNRSRRWLRRHQTVATTAAALIMISILGLTIFSGLLSAKQQELTEINQRLVLAQEKAMRAAESAETKRREAERERVKAEQASALAIEAQETTEAFSRFLTENILATARPKGREGGLGIDVTVVKALEEAEQQIELVFSGKPQAEATARDGIGRTWYVLGKYSRAEEHQARAIELFEENGLTDDRYFHALGNYASTLLAMGRFEQAIATGQRVEQEFLKRHGPDDESSLAASNNLANAFLRVGQYEQARQRLERVVSVSNERYGPHAEETFPSRINLAEALRYLGTEARRRALEIMQSVLQDQKELLGEKHPDTLVTVNNLASFYAEQGETQRAVRMLQTALLAMQETVGPKHPLTIDAMSNYGKAMFQNGQIEAGLEMMRQGWELSDEVLSEEHPDTLVALDLYAFHLGEAGETEEGIRLMEIALNGRRRALGESNIDTLTTMNNLALMYEIDGKMDQALRLHAESVAGRRELCGESSYEYRLALGNYGIAALNAGQTDLASQLLNQLVQLNLQVRGPEAPETWESLEKLAAAQSRMGLFEQAAESLDQALASASRVLPITDQRTIELLFAKGLVLRDGSEFQAAAEVFREVIQRESEYLREESGDEARLMNLRGVFAELAMCENRLQQYEQAAEHARQSIELAKKLIPDDWRLFNARSVLGESLMHLGQIEQAESYLLEAHQGLWDRRETIPPFAIRPWLSASFDRLIELSKLQGKEQEQSQWQKKKEEFLQ